MSRLPEMQQISLQEPLVPQTNEKPAPQIKNVTSLTNKSWIQSILSQREILYWCLFFFVTNLTITFYNKHILSELNISPLINTFIHMTFTFVGCLIVHRKFPSLTLQEFVRMILYSFIFALNIIWCQYSIKLTTLSLNQVCRAITPLFQVTFSYLIANKKHTMFSLIPLLPVCLGVAMTANSELDLGFIPLIVSVSSVIVSALKGVLSMKILQQDLKTKLQEYSFLIIVCPLAAIWIILFELFFYCLYSNESHNTPELLSITELFTPYTIFLLSIGGCMAFAVNVASIGAVKRTSATSMGVMANSKQALTIFGSIMFVESNWIVNKFIGICITLFGACWYSYRKEIERRQKSTLPK